MTKARVIIVGGGFAGLAAARGLDQRHSVTLIDHSASFEYLPNLHELVSRTKRPRSLRASRARLVASHGHTFLQDEVLAIDASRRSLTTLQGHALDYDALIVATGSVAATRGLPDFHAHAVPLRSISNGVCIGARLRELARSGARHTVTVVGGGFSGVECLGEILRRYRDRRRLHVRLIESGPHLLPGQPRAIHRSLRRLLRTHRVELLTGESVAALEAGRLRLASDTWLDSDLTIWTAGAAPPALLARSGLAPEGRWIQTRPDLRWAGHERVFVAGDGAELPRPLAKQSYHATTMGRRAAANLTRYLAGRAPKPHAPPDERLLVSFGHLSGFYVDDSVVLESAALCVVREALFQLGMLELDRPAKSDKARRLWLERLSDGLRRRNASDALRAFMPASAGQAGLDLGWPALPRLLAWRDHDDRDEGHRRRRLQLVRRPAFTGSAS